MQTATVHEIFAPLQEQMLAHAMHLFADQLHGLVELAWTDPNQGAPRHAQLFPLDRLDEMVEQAAEVNAERRNIYIGAALRKEDTPLFGRTAAEDFYAATALWADLDDAGGTMRAADACKRIGVRPTLAVITGRHPHERGQLWWRLAEPLPDAAQVKVMLARIQQQLGGDAAVVDPIRIMRLGGTVAWPVKDGRQAERTQVVK